jgi:hypothetical protein
MEPQAGLTVLLLIFVVYLGIPCAAQQSGQTASESASPRQQPPATKSAGPYLVVLGIAQDGGYPQAGCRRECCARAWRDASLRRGVSCLGIVDPAGAR